MLLVKARRQLPAPRSQLTTQPYDQITASALLDQDIDALDPTGKSEADRQAEILALDDAAPVPDDAAKPIADVAASKPIEGDSEATPTEDSATRRRPRDSARSTRTRTSPSRLPLRLLLRPRWSPRIRSLSPHRSHRRVLRRHRRPQARRSPRLRKLVQRAPACHPRGWMARRPRAQAPRDDAPRDRGRARRDARPLFLLCRVRASRGCALAFPARRDRSARADRALAAGPEPDRDRRPQGPRSAARRPRRLRAPRHRDAARQLAGRPRDAQLASGAGYTALAADWKTAVWSCAKFKLDAPMRFQLQWQIVKPNVEGLGLAWIDDDGDGDPDRAIGFRATAKGTRDVDFTRSRRWRCDLSSRSAEPRRERAREQRRSLPRELGLRRRDVVASLAPARRGPRGQPARSLRKP